MLTPLHPGRPVPVDPTLRNLQLSPNGNYLLAHTDTSLRIRRLRDGKQIQQDLNPKRIVHVQWLGFNTDETEEASFGVRPCILIAFEDAIAVASFEAVLHVHPIQRPETLVRCHVVHTDTHQDVWALLSDAVVVHAFLPSLLQRPPQADSVFQFYRLSNGSSSPPRTIVDIHCIPRTTPTLFEEHPNRKQTMILAYGENPTCALYIAGVDNKPGSITELATAVVSRVSDVVSNLSTRFWNTTSPTPGPNSVDAPPPTASIAKSLPASLSWKDQRRSVQAVFPSPCGRFLLSTDVLGRVSLIRVSSLHVLHMWKGYREAQCGWITHLESTGDAGRETWGMYIVLYTPNRDSLELWKAPHGPRVASISVRTPCTLFSCTDQTGKLARCALLLGEVGSSMLYELTPSPKSMERLEAHVQASSGNVDDDYAVKQVVGCLAAAQEAGKQLSGELVNTCCNWISQIAASEALYDALVDSDMAQVETKRRRFAFDADLHVALLDQVDTRFAQLRDHGSEPVAAPAGDFAVPSADSLKHQRQATFSRFFAKYLTVRRTVLSEYMRLDNLLRDCKLLSRPNTVRPQPPPSASELENSLYTYVGFFHVQTMERNRRMSFPRFLNCFLPKYQKSESSLGDWTLTVGGRFLDKRVRQAKDSPGRLVVDVARFLCQPLLSDVFALNAVLDVLNVLNVLPENQLDLFSQWWFNEDITLILESASALSGSNPAAAFVKHLVMNVHLDLAKQDANVRATAARDAAGVPDTEPNSSSLDAWFATCAGTSLAGHALCLAGYCRDVLHEVVQGLDGKAGTDTPTDSEYWVLAWSQFELDRWARLVLRLTHTVTVLNLLYGDNKQQMSDQRQRVSAETLWSTEPLSKLVAVELLSSVEPNELLQCQARLAQAQQQGEGTDAQGKGSEDPLAKLSAKYPDHFAHGNEYIITWMVVVLVEKLKQPTETMRNRDVLFQLLAESISVVQSPTSRVNLVLYVWRTCLRAQLTRIVKQCHKATKPAEVESFPDVSVMPFARQLLETCLHSVNGVLGGELAEVFVPPMKGNLDEYVNVTTKHVVDRPGIVNHLALLEVVEIMVVFKLKGISIKALFPAGFKLLGECPFVVADATEARTEHVAIDEAVVHKRLLFLSRVLNQVRPAQLEKVLQVSKTLSVPGCQVLCKYTEILYWKGKDLAAEDVLNKVEQKGDLIPPLLEIARYRMGLILHGMQSDSRFAHLLAAISADTSKWVQQHGVAPKYITKVQKAPSLTATHSLMLTLENLSSGQTSRDPQLAKRIEELLSVASELLGRLKDERT